MQKVAGIQCLRKSTKKLDDQYDFIDTPHTNQRCLTYVSFSFTIYVIIPAGINDNAIEKIKQAN